MSNHYPDKSYYLFSSRIFEVMVGVIIAYIPEKTNNKKTVYNILSIITFVALILIANCNTV
ncbi:hypothetical protein R0K20_18375, partial [Staphylococcus sp. SIMBA_130]